MPSRTRVTVTGAFDVVNTRVLNQSRSSCAGAWSAGTTSTSNSGTVFRKEIVDHTTPGFFSILARKGCLPNNLCQINKSLEVRTAGPYFHQYLMSGGCYRRQSSGSFWLFNTPLVQPPPIDEDIINEVSQIAMSKCKTAIFDALTTIAESKQTAKLIVTAWGRVESFATRAAKYARRFRSPRQAALAFSEKWLEYRYGWMPAIYSAEDAMKAYNAWQGGRKLIFGKGFVGTTISEHDTKIVTQAAGNGGLATISQTDSLTGNRRYCGKSWGWANSRVGSKYAGFDPILTAWELVPYSFVADWFLGIGTFLKASSPFGGAALVGGSCSISESLVYRQTYDHSYHSGETGSAGPLSTEITTESYSRFGNTPGTLPVWNPNLNFKRYVDAFSLILQGTRRVRSLRRK